MGVPARDKELGLLGVGHLPLCLLFPHEAQPGTSASVPESHTPAHLQLQSVGRQGSFLSSALPCANPKHFHTDT